MLLLCLHTSYHSSSTGYFPVRQAVQWPLRLLVVLELMTLSFRIEPIPSCTADTRPSTVRYWTLSAPTKTEQVLAEVHKTDKMKQI